MVDNEEWDVDDVTGIPWSGIKAIVQPTAWRETSYGKGSAIKDKLFETHLCRCYEVYTPGRFKAFDENQEPSWFLSARIECVAVEQLLENILVAEENPGLTEGWPQKEGKRHVWWINKRREHWAKKFPLPDL